MHLLHSVLIFLLLLGTKSYSDDSVPPNVVKLNVQTLANSNEFLLVLNFENHPQWHTYWKNPGDAGLAIKNKFSVNKKPIELSEKEWPAPKRFIENGNQWAYGYEGGYSLFYQLDKKALNAMAGKNIELHSTWLVCRHICVPGEKRISFKIKNNVVETSEPNILSQVSITEMTSRLLNLPMEVTKPDYLDFKLSKGIQDKSLVLTYDLKKSTDVNFLKNTNLIIAFPSAPFDMGHENLTVKDDGLRGIVEANWDGEYSDPPVDLPKDGKFKKPYKLKFLFNDPIQRKSFVVEETFNGFDLNQISLPPIINSSLSTPTLEQNKIAGNSTLTSSSLFYYMILALLGGLILNIMPCVLPVISLKLFGLIKYQNESRSRILKHNLSYTLGILVTFLILALTVLGLKSIGMQVGWGFQLQSPNFIALMVVVLFIFSLNLFGLFEFATPGGKTLGNIQTKEGFLGDFLSGVLATILSTPCSAPFLGTALTFAFSSNAVSIIVVFLMIGVGLALPFILTAFIPSLISALPKPGPWMNTVKKLLGVTLILTILWLFDVYNALVDGSSHLIKLGTSLIFIFVGFGILKKDRWFGGISFLASLALLLNLSTTEIVPSKNDSTALIRDKQAAGLSWEAWSYEKMKEHQDNQQLVFMDFTAKWCFTCKVNEKVILETKAFKQLVSKHDLKLLIGDWTKRDEVIASFLKQQGLVGVPAYFIQKRDGTLINLGETITIKKIEQHL